ncbi:DUF6261 family protein [Bacteroides sp.]|uniref:DUF6261 family protein n=1 Tax=Bacteroides sp. TaxID=29523 RepID=UPI002FC992ED
MPEIISISTERMNNGAHFAYHTEVLARANADSKVKTKISAQLTAYRAALDKEDTALVLSRKNQRTDEISRADSQRDSLYIGIKNTVRAFENAADPDMQQAADALTQLFKDYKIETSMQLDRETGLLYNLISDLEGKYASQVSALSLTGLLAALKTANESVRTAMSIRTSELAAKEIGALKNARSAVDERYRTIVKYINAYALIEGDADYQGFIDVTNTEIVRYKRQVLGQGATRTQSSKSGEESEDVPENPFE